MAKRRSSKNHLFKVIFLNQGKVYEVYARSVTQGALFGFIEVEELLFGERSKLVVDPSEESLKTEFSGVRRFHVPLHSVVRVDEVEKQGASRIVDGGTKDGEPVAFPVPVPFPGNDTPKS